MTPLEAVARAICKTQAVGDTDEEIDDCVADCWPDFVESAKVVLSALAANITEEMGMVARLAWYRRGPCHPENEAKDMRDAIAAAIAKGAEG